MGIGIAIDLGPGSRPHVKLGLHPSDPDRLIIVERPVPVGCMVIGLAALAGASACEAYWLRGLMGSGKDSEGSLVGLVLLSLIGGFLLLSRVHCVLDRRRNLLVEGFGFFVPFWKTHRKLSEFDRIAIERESGQHTKYRVSLRGAQQEYRIDSVGAWEGAVPIAEALAHFLHLPIRDEESGTTRTVEELDLSLREQIARGTEAGQAPPRPRDGRVRIIREAPDLLRAYIPRPGKKAGLLVAILIFTLIFWAVPVSFLGGLWIGLFPPAIVLACWIKAALGYSARVEVTPAALRVWTRGLILPRTVEIPAAELEEVRIHSLEYGGPREVLAECFDNILVARSDRASVRFGYGLSGEELAWLRGTILKIAGSPAGGLFRARGARGIAADRAAERPAYEVPAFPSRRYAAIGFAAGAIAGNLMGGALGVCVAAPFLEHALNAGAAIGAVAGAILDGWPRPGDALGRPRTLFLAVLMLLGAMYLLFVPDNPAIQPCPSYGERSLLRLDDRSWRFWAGWLPAGLALSVLALNVVGWLVLGTVYRLLPKRWKGAAPGTPSVATAPGAAQEGSKGEGCAMAFRYVLGAALACGALALLIAGLRELPRGLGEDSVLPLVFGLILTIPAALLLTTKGRWERQGAAYSRCLGAFLALCAVVGLFGGGLYALATGERASGIPMVFGAMMIVLVGCLILQPQRWIGYDSGNENEFQAFCGGSIAALVGLLIVAISFVDDESRFPSGRTPARAAGLAFLLAGAAILWSVLKTMDEGQMAALGALAAALLLTIVGAGALVSPPAGIAVLAAALGAWIWTIRCIVRLRKGGDA